MTFSLELALALTGLVGLSLGLLGGGGSILAVPVLVYVARLAPADAIGLSLVIVGGTSVAGALAHARAGAVEWRAALPFAGAGVATAFVGGLLTRLVPGRMLLFAFAALMIGVGVWMLVRGRRRGPAGAAPPHPPRPIRALAAGALVGGVTGFLGVGGGFLVVPALIAFTGLDMRRAVGTSLVVIAINSAAALAAHLGEGRLRLLPAVAFTTLAVGGALVGARVGRRLAADKLRTAFASFVVAVGVTMVLRTSLGG